MTDITAWNLYWLTRLDGIGVFFWVVAIGALTVLGIVMAKRSIDEDFPSIYTEEMRESNRLGVRWSLRIAVVALPIAVLTPTTKQAAAIILLPEIINLAIVQEEIPAEAREVYGLAKEWLRDQVEESTP